MLLSVVGALPIKWWISTLASEAFEMSFHSKLIRDYPRIAPLGNRFSELRGEIDHHHVQFGSERVGVGLLNKALGIPTVDRLRREACNRS